MKHSPHHRCLTILVLSLASLVSLLSAESEIPTGTLTVDRSLVRLASRSQLDWQINYPTTIDDLVDVTDPGTVVPTRTLIMRVRALGVAFQSGSRLLPLEGSWSLNNSPWTRFFYGTGPTVVPTRILIETQVHANDRIDFGARGWSGSSWYPFHHTRTADRYVVVLKNGDSAPNYAPAYQQGTIKSFMAPYVDSAGRIRIGPRDLIILWEASTAAPGTTYFDMQDLVVLVTFDQVLQ